MGVHSEGAEPELGAAMASLFLKRNAGEPVLPRRFWPDALSMLRRCSDPSDSSAFAEIFSIGGWWEAAALLKQPGRAKSYAHLIGDGLVETVCGAAYPRRWIDVLGRAAPAAYWVAASACFVGENERAFAVVGSRRISRHAQRFCFEAGAAVASAGGVVVSGGAVGCDSWAEAGALSVGGSVLRIVPYGLDWEGAARLGVGENPRGMGAASRWMAAASRGIGAASRGIGAAEFGVRTAAPGIGAARLGVGVARLGVLEGERRRVDGAGAKTISVCAPDEEFSTGTAMERNALIYAAAPRSLVVEARFREGGAWHGAVTALRRRLSYVFHRDTGADWCRALAAMGSHPISSPEEFLSAEISERSRSAAVMPVNSLFV